MVSRKGFASNPAFQGRPHGSVAAVLATLVPAPGFSSQNQCEKLGVAASFCSPRAGDAGGPLGSLARQPGLLGEF